jgi:hypothetical protein
MQDELGLLQSEAENLMFSITATNPALGTQGELSIEAEVSKTSDALLIGKIWMFFLMQWVYCFG